MIYFIRAQMARTNAHELDARMNFMIYGTMLSLLFLCIHFRWEEGAWGRGQGNRENEC